MFRYCTGGLPRYDERMHLDRSLLAGALIMTAAAVWGQTAIPDHDRTPGAIDPDISQENIAQTVCVLGYTKIVRPPSSYTTRLKIEQMRELGLPGTTSDYHEDH